MVSNMSDKSTDNISYDDSGHHEREDHPEDSDGAPVLDIDMSFRPENGWITIRHTGPRGPASESSYYSDHSDSSSLPSPPPSPRPPPPAPTRTAQHFWRRWWRRNRRTDYGVPIFVTESRPSTDNQPFPCQTDGTPGKPLVEAQVEMQEPFLYHPSPKAPSLSSSISSLDLGEPLVPLPPKHVNWDAVPRRAPAERTSASRMIWVRAPTPHPRHSAQGRRYDEEDEDGETTDGGNCQHDECYSTDMNTAMWLCQGIAL